MVGWIREVTNSYEAGLYFLGGLALVAGVLTLIIVNARFGEARKTGVKPSAAKPVKPGRADYILKGKARGAGC